MSKLPLWKESWEEAEKAWDENAERSAKERPIKGLKTLPNMPGITPDTAKNLRLKSLHWMVTQDHEKKIQKGFLRHPLKHTWNFLRSILKKTPYHRKGDFFFYGISGEKAFIRQLKEKNTLFVLGFSYCHKPFECPSGRFTPDCVHDPSHPVCSQCFIGKCQHAVKETETTVLVIPTVHYIGGEILALQHKNPTKKILFLITACEMTLIMFADYGNMAGIQGIGARLDGRICNTMKAFQLSEKGIKPGLTVVLDKTQKKILDLLSYTH